MFIKHALRILICLTLAFNGLVQAEVRLPCPMNEASSRQHNAMECCAEQVDTAKKLCKSGVQCQAISIMVQLLSFKPPTQYAHQPVVLANTEFIASAAPSSVWRPPRA